MVLSSALRQLIVNFLKRVNPRGYEEQDQLAKLIQLLEQKDR